MSARRQFPAFILSVLVHIVLGCILVYGFRWEIPQPKPAMLELWSAPKRVPHVEITPPTPITPPQKIALEPVRERADINLKKPEKQPPKKAEKERKIAVKPVEKLAPKPEEKAPPKPVAKTTPQPPPKKAAPPATSDHTLDELTKNLSDQSTQATPTPTPSKISGTTSSGVDVKALKDSYGDKFTAMLKKKYRVLPGTPDGLSANVSITLLPDGTILNWNITDSSGNAAFDQSLLNTIESLGKGPPPPKGLPYSEIRDIKIHFKP